MYRSLKIEGFRRFRRLELQELARVNLLVGRNNSGKTSVLEAISMLASPASLRDLLIRRGETVVAMELLEGDPLSLAEELDLTCIFHNYSSGNGGLSLAGSGTWNHFLKARIEVVDPNPRLVLEIEEGKPVAIDISVQAGLPLLVWSGDSATSIRRANHPFPQRTPERNVTKIHLEPQGVTARRLAADLGSVLLTPEEDLLLEALRLIEPSIQRIAPLPREANLRLPPESQKSGIFVLSEGRRRVPLGNMGDGIWRLLMLALSLVNASKGILLVDEIDTGLHHTVLEGMWRLVLKTAAKLEVQVFATTHSDDCWKALARVLEAENGALDEAVSLQRLEMGRQSSVVFPGNRIRIAAANDIEVR